MELSNKNVHTKQRQFEILVNFMCEHPGLAQGQMTGKRKQISNNLWKRLTVLLNKEGPPIRDATAWKKVWADHKSYVKSKLRKNTKGCDSEGVPFKYYSFTPSEKQIIKLLNFEDEVNDMAPVPAEFDSYVENEVTNNEEKDSQKASIIEPEIESESEKTKKDDVPCSSYIKGRLPHRKKESLLEKQVNNQVEYQKNSYRVLKKINKNLKSIAKYQKRKFELSEKKHKLEKDKYEHRRKNDLEKNRIKLAKLEVQKEMLRLTMQKHDGLKMDNEQ